MKDLNFPITQSYDTKTQKAGLPANIEGCYNCCGGIGRGKSEWRGQKRERGGNGKREYIY